MKLETTIDATYLSGSSGWNAAAGIREILQNGRDAEIEQEAPLSVTWHNDTLRIENAGATLPREAILMGRSSKRDDSRMAGKFGEGLKVGILVLLRAGHTIKIRTGSDVWTPTIAPSEKFGGVPVLTFNIEGGREDKNRVRVEVTGVTQEAWKALQDNFLFLHKREIKKVETTEGNILLGDRWAGRVYVKGILVQHRPELVYGYDLHNADIDRDRRIMDSWDLKARLRRIWFEAVQTRPDMMVEFTTLLESREAEDVQGIDQFYTHSVPEAAAQAVAKTFRKRHGENAIPVANLAEAADIEHYGVRGIICPAPLAAVLAAALGTTEKVRENLRTEVVKTYSWHELSFVQKTNINEALKLLVGAGVEATLADIDIVDFRSDSLEGMFKDNRILLASKHATDRKGALEVLVHEFAHRQGGDGEKNHVAAIERTWSDIVEGLRG